MRAGCNRSFGTSAIAGEQLSFGAIGATRMACAPAPIGQETGFCEALGSATRRTIDENGLLLIDSAGGEEPSRFAVVEG